MVSPMMKVLITSLSNNNIVIITVQSKDLSLAMSVKKPRILGLNKTRDKERLTGE